MQNFGKIKTLFNNLIIEGILMKNDTIKKMFKQYLNKVRESNILKTQFLVYQNIENRIDEDVLSANIYVNENISLLSKFPTDDIIKENKKLVELLGDYSNRLDSVYSEDNLHESITKLIFTKRTPSNTDVITESTKNIINYIKDNKKIVNEPINTVPTSILRNIMVEKFNEKYSSANEDDKEIIKVLIEGSIEDKRIIYQKHLTETLNIINNYLVESDSETKDKLLEAKSKLEETIEIDENNFINKISKLIELKNNLMQ